jgi:23S rRNA (adenine2503-C2)-methyltransferase
MDKDLKNRTLEELNQLVETFGEKTYLARYIFSFIHARGATDIAAVTALSKAFRRRLAEAGFYISQLSVLQQHTGADGTEKYVFAAADGVRLESVLLPTGRRVALCVSSQAGCRMGCRFCATGRLKFQRSLTAAEIVDQVYLVSSRYGRVGNIVYMGMGEPMDNFDEVLRSVRILMAPQGLNIGARHITISTCGVPEAIARLADCQLQVRLAVSLNAATDAIRRRIMPAAARWPLSRLMAALKDYQKKTGRRVTIEYCPISNVNDSPEQALALARLVAPLKANVNLIEFNPHPGCEFAASDRRQVEVFARLLRQNGLSTVIRYRRGRDIKAACGQLGASQLASGSGAKAQKLQPPR